MLPAIKKPFHRIGLLLIALLFGQILLLGAQDLTFKVTMADPVNHLFHVQMTDNGVEDGKEIYCMPRWTPGYYQMLDFAKNVKNLSASDTEGRPVTVEKRDADSWMLTSVKGSGITLEYDVLADRNFVATSFLDENRGYMIPGAVFLYPEGRISESVTIGLDPGETWKDVATGLDRAKGSEYTFLAGNFDVLYDSPILIGNLDSLPSFTVEGIPHYFTGYKLGTFDQSNFMKDLKSIIEVATSLIGEIPYNQYTFIGIGPGRGGIEHLNSTCVSFNGNSLSSHQRYLGVLSFLAHEYFHTYNVKRIRPIELGPFDYLNENNTNLLWVSEGLTVYYEYLLLKRAGLFTDDELLRAFQSNIKAHENRPGRHYQTLADASYYTWRDGPFGNQGEGIEKTISYYDKGPLVGLLLDLEIRRATQNSKSLDDVMRRLYYEYYREKNRGFTEDELRAVCEEIAGVTLDEIFEYVYTTRDLNYNKYLGYAGYQLDTASFSIIQLPEISKPQEMIRSGWLTGQDAGK